MFTDELARTCEGCGSIQKRHDDLQICWCELMENLCKDCRAACEAFSREEEDENLGRDD